MNPLSSEAINKHVVSERISEAAQLHPKLFVLITETVLQWQNY